MKRIGMSFEAELSAAGLLGLPFSWGDDGSLSTDQLSEAERVAVIAVYAAHNPDTPVVPQTVTMRQARLALFQAGLLAQVDAVIAAMTSPQKEAAQIEWQYASEVHRNKALVLTLGPALGLSDAQLDQLFITAATL